MPATPEPSAPVPAGAVLPGQGRWRWDAEFRPRLVELSSPHSPAECGRRLEALTTQRRSAGWLGSFSLDGGRARLFGRVGPLGIRVCRLADVTGNSYLRPWFDGRIDVAPEGGTVLRGSVGPSPAALPGLLAFLVAEGVGCLYFAANGLDSLLSGHPVLAMVYLVVTGTLLALNAVMVAIVPRRMRNRAQSLLRELNHILRSAPR